jgi:hypothetical protein
MIKTNVLILVLFLCVGCYHHRSHHHHHHKHRPVTQAPPEVPKYGTRYKVVVNERGEKELQRVDSNMINEP